MLSRKSQTKILVIARREFTASVHSKAFVLGIVLPTAMFVFLLFLGPEGGSRSAGTAGVQGLGLYSAFLYMFLLLMGILGMGKHMLTSLIEEKNSHIVEVLLSAVSPFELMCGKILGLCGAGLTAIGIATAFIVCAASYRGLLGLFSPMSVVYLVVYYVLGFLLASSAFAALGSACNRIRDAQGLLLPVAIPFVLPIVFWMQIARDPNGLLALVFSFLPPTAAPTMVVRLAARPGLSPWQVAASLAVLGLSVPLAVVAAARVFRTAILMFGKPPGLREILRWAVSD